MAKKDNENKRIATDVLSLVGGKENVSTVAHCMTRLRLTLKDESKIDVEAIKKVDGVMGCVNQEGQLQVILGPGKVNKVCTEFEKLAEVKAGSVSEDDNGKA
ncbi:MAG: PTS transporter subunit EIIB [Clostridium sp.]|nr:PTS transporter subunit EIIB [Clostridium sp.]